MRLSKLIAKVGDDNVVVQNLDESADEFKLVGGAGLISFFTDPKHVTERLRNNQKHIALVVWIPVDKLPVNSAETEAHD